MSAKEHDGRVCGLRVGGEGYAKACVEECELWDGDHCAVTAIAIELRKIAEASVDLQSAAQAFKKWSEQEQKAIGECLEVVTEATAPVEVRALDRKNPCPKCALGEMVSGTGIIDANTGKGFRPVRCDNCGWKNDVTIEDGIDRGTVKEEADHE